MTALDQVLKVYEELYNLGSAEPRSSANFKFGSLKMLSL